MILKISTTIFGYQMTNWEKHLKTPEQNPQPALLIDGVDTCEIIQFTVDVGQKSILEYHHKPTCKYCQKRYKNTKWT